MIQDAYLPFGIMRAFNAVKAIALPESLAQGRVVAMLPPRSLERHAWPSPGKGARGVRSSQCGVTLDCSPPIALHVLDLIAAIFSRASFSMAVNRERICMLPCEDCFEARCFDLRGVGERHQKTRKKVENRDHALCKS